MRATFQNTLSILVTAYLNNTLVQGHPCGCGCGNIIAGVNNFKVISNGDNETARWEGAYGSGFDWYEVIAPGKTFKGNRELGLIQIHSTGYTIEDFRKIESAFEDVNKLDNGQYAPPTEESIFNGLMAVVDVLAEIHGIDLTEKESAKALFVKA